MKTSLAIVLATIALTFGAMLSFTSGVAAHDYGSLSGKSPGRCGVAACVIDLAPHYPRPLAQALIVAIVRLCDVPAGLSLGRLVGPH